jgi:hypothetical protein
VHFQYNASGLTLKPSCSVNAFVIPDTHVHLYMCMVYRITAMFSTADHMPCTPHHSSYTVPLLNPKSVIAREIKVADSPRALCHCTYRRADCTLWEWTTFIVSLQSRRALNRSHKEHIKLNSLSLRIVGRVAYLV